MEMKQKGIKDEVRRETRRRWLEEKNFFLKEKVKKLKNLGVFILWILPKIIN